MGRLRRDNDAPRVVGFDFGPPGAPAAPPVTPAPPAYEPPPAPPAPPAYAAPPPPPAYAAPPAPPAYEPAPDFGPSPFAPPAPGTRVAAPPPEPAYAAPAAPPFASAAPMGRYDTYATYAPPAPAPAPPAPAPPQAAGPAPFTPFSPFAPPAAEPAPLTGNGENVPHWRPGAPIPPQWGGEIEQRRPARRHSSFPVRSVVTLVVVVGVAVVGAYRGYQRYFGEPFTTPKAIGNATLMETPEMLEISEDMKTDLRGIGRPVAGVYGVGGLPSFIMIAGDSSEGSSKSMYDVEMLIGAKTEGYTFSKPTMVGDVACGDYVEASMSGTGCAWASGKSDGVLFFFERVALKEAAKITALTKTAVESE